MVKKRLRASGGKDILSVSKRTNAPAAIGPIHCPSTHPISEASVRWPAALRRSPKTRFFLPDPQPTQFGLLAYVSRYS